MKKRVRQGVFETNSSSVHTLTIATEEEFKKWKNGELLLSSWDKTFVPPNFLDDDEKNDARIAYEDTMKTYWKDWSDLSDEEKEEWYIKYAKESGLNDDLDTYDDFMHTGCYETYEKHFETPSGDKMVAFGQYGMD